CSCTIPHKEAALANCDEVDPIAKSIGAVNCIIRKPADGKLFGCNTDYVGAISAIEDGLRGLPHNPVDGPLAGKIFVVIGAGGAGKALAYGAKEKGAKVVVANRTYERARELADIVGGQALSLAELSTFHPENGMILANTTSIGMQPKIDETPAPKEALSCYSLVFDAVYTPKITRLLREAEECGAEIVTGVEMFIGQAYEQYERFTGLPAPKELFKSIMSKY
ncbi:bifunctional 3-dehydroquinate dehydratase/shikimate dehydrogenase, chloroplastic-like, partial [Ipomoea triloba]|uniref:bifunctional 3-dehydroquinate dehydratase/shikimate dehydrogenase, chloroplastic-like n=1 Tax=Ipomoea triloba TaxID=35885 RepID=UPI00125D1489